MGIVYQKTSTTTKKIFGKGASVFIPGISSTTTDDQGYYSLDISRCAKCKAGATVSIYVNSSIGHVERDYTITEDSALKPFNIELTENGKLSLTGTIADKRTGKLIQGIKVSALIQNSDTPAFSITNDQGIFEILIRKEGISDLQAIQLIFSDADHGKYRDAKETVFINQYEPISVEMEECLDGCGFNRELKVNTHVQTDIKVEKGDIIIIKANGVMKIGNWIGTSGPEGRLNSSGILGVSLAAYNYNEFKNWNHAVLVFRFGKEDEWKYYQKDKELKYRVPAAGYVEFAVNDTQQGDNEGAYDVEVIMRK